LVAGNLLSNPKWSRLICCNAQFNWEIGKTGNLPLPVPAKMSDREAEDYRWRSLLITGFSDSPP
jgi:hypothetical protein